MEQGRLYTGGILSYWINIVWIYIPQYRISLDELVVSREAGCGNIVRRLREKTCWVECSSGIIVYDVE